MPDFAAHLLAGTAAGISQIVIGHPFDTIKVKMQASTSKAGALAITAQTLCAPLASTPEPQHVQTVRAEGVRGLYRGMGMLLASVAACNAVLFTSRGMAQGWLKREGQPLSLKDHVMASMFGGTACAILTSPVDVIKCRLQFQGSYEVALQRFKVWDANGRMGPAPTLYRGPSDVFKHLSAQGGLVRGLSAGLGTCLLRDGIGCGAMFAVYEGLKGAIASSQGIEKEELGMLPLVMSGGLGGIACWLTVYPLDTIKSALQTQSLSQPQYKGLWDCGRQLVKANGIKALYKGLGPCLARSFPANAAAFLAYEHAFKAIKSWHP